MKKNIFSIFIILFVLTSNIIAQDKSAFDKGNIVITGGFGVPNFNRIAIRTIYKAYGPTNETKVTGIGPIIFKAEYGIIKFKWGHSVGAGFVIGYNSTKIDFKYKYNYYYTSGLITYNQIDYYKTLTIGARGVYHFYTKEKIDCYANIALGFNVNLVNQTTNDPNGIQYASASRPNVYEAFTVGVRYYFTKNIGVYAEAGWDVRAPLQGGIALKF